MKVVLCSVVVCLVMVLPEMVAQTARVPAAEVGLPIYPGATPDRDGDPAQFPGPVAFNDRASAIVEIPGGRGKFVVLRLQTPDDADRVAAFYRNALAMYGTILDCSQPTTAAPTRPDSVTCAAGLGGSTPRLNPGEVLFRAGTRNQQHLVGIQKRGTVTAFQLVYNEFRPRRQ